MRLLEGHRGAVRAVAYAPDGELLATGGEDGTVRLWNLHAGGPPEVLPELPAGVEALAWSPGGEALAAGTARGRIYVRRPGAGWDELRGEHAGGVRMVAFFHGDPGQESVLSAGWDNRLRLEGYQFAVQAAGLTWPCGPVAAYFPTRPTIAYIAADRRVHLQQLGPPPFDQHSELPFPAEQALAFAPDGERLAAGRLAGEVVIWDVADGSVLRTLWGHTWVVFGLAFGSDGRTLASGSADGTVRLWDVDRGAERACYRFHRRWVTAVAFAPDGLTVAAAGADGLVAVCDVG